MSGFKLRLKSWAAPSLGGRGLVVEFWTPRRVSGALRLLSENSVTFGTGPWKGGKSVRPLGGQQMNVSRCPGSLADKDRKADRKQRRKLRNGAVGDTEEDPAEEVQGSREKISDPPAKA